MAAAGYSTTVKITGTTTAFVGAACTLVSGTTYQINDTAKRIFDPSVALTAYDGVSGATITEADYLFGKITLSAAPAGAVTLDGSYLPTLSVAEAKEFDLTASRDMLENTVFDSSNSHKTRQAGLKDASGSIGTFDTLATDLDSGAGETILFDVFSNGTAKVLEIKPGNVGNFFRSFVLFESEDLKSAVGDLINSTIGWQSAPQASTDSFTPASYSWGA